jgi:hypothetical protein
MLVCGATVIDTQLRSLVVMIHTRPAIRLHATEEAAHCWNSLPDTPLINTPQVDILCSGEIHYERKLRVKSIPCK